MTFYQILWTFFFYSFAGWCCEVVFAACKTGKFVNRGFSSGAGLPHIRIWRHGGRFADCTHPSALAASLFGRDAGSDDHRVFRRLGGRQAVARPPVGLLRYAAESQRICVPAVFSRVGLGLPFHRRGFPSHGPSPVGLGSHDSGLDPVGPVYSYHPDRFHSHRPWRRRRFPSACKPSTSWSAACAVFPTASAAICRNIPWSSGTKGRKSCGLKKREEFWNSLGSRKRNSWLSGTKFWKSTTPCWNGPDGSTPTY